jgi:hypothetical protein
METLDHHVSTAPARDYRPLDHNFALALLHRLLTPPPNQRPSDWCAENLYFNEPEVKGLCDFTGRQYLRKLIDDNNDASVFKQTSVFATGLGKTVAHIAGVIYKIKHKPQRCLWVMPSEKGATGVRNFNKTRLIPACEASPKIRELMPVGASRHDISGLHIRMGGMVIDFAGSNSPGQLAANRCGDVRLDETDKFKTKLGNEAGAVYIAETRTDGVVGAQIFDSSTPTIDTGPIWQSLCKSNLNRRFIPCPHCHKAGKTLNLKLGTLNPSNLVGYFVIAWSEQFSILPKRFPDGTDIPIGYVFWDKEAKRKDGTWDLDRVIRSAHVECPHCHGHIHDTDMLWCDENGHWLPTRTDTAANRHVGYHLPRMYAPRRGFESTFGGIAKKFLECRNASEGMRGFINSDLAEPDVTQEHARGGIEIITENRISTVDWCPLMSIDIQKKWPFAWFVIRKISTFQLLAPLPLSDGRFDPTIITPRALELCEKLAANHPPAWHTIAELLRFDSRTEDFILLHWLLAQDITGDKLVRLYLDRCQANTLDLGRHIYREMGLRMPRGGDSEAIAVGHTQTDDWAELREIAQQYDVGKNLPYRNHGVIVDSGYGAYEDAQVMRNTFEMAKEFSWYDPIGKGFWKNQIHNRCKPFAKDGWIPCKGYPITRQWNVDGIMQRWKYRIDDPFKGTSLADQYVHYVFDFASDHFWEKLDDLRHGRAPNQFKIAANCDIFPTDGKSPQFKDINDYLKQLDARFKDRDGTIKNRGGTGGGATRLWPDHLNDADRNLIALAHALGFYSYDLPPVRTANS